MRIREMTMDDISAVAEMERNNSQTPWDENSLFTYFMRDDTVLVVAEDFCESCAPEEAHPVIGFCGLICAPPEADVLDITVDLASRNRGTGTALLDAAIQSAHGTRGVDTVYLEVRVSNAPARHLYEKLGFKQTGLRKRYYTDPVEDAITETLHLCK